MLTSMQKYATILITIDVIAIIVLDQGDRRLKVALNLAILLPIFGRIFGWW